MSGRTYAPRHWYVAPRKSFDILALYKSDYYYYTIMDARMDRHFRPTSLVQLRILSRPNMRGRWQPPTSCYRDGEFTLQTLYWSNCSQNHPNQSHHYNRHHTAVQYLWHCIFRCDTSLHHYTLQCMLWNWKLRNWKQQETHIGVENFSEAIEIIKCIVPILHKDFWREFTPQHIHVVAISCRHLSEHNARTCKGWQQFENLQLHDSAKHWPPS